VARLIFVIFVNSFKLFRLFMFFCLGVVDPLPSARINDDIVCPGGGTKIRDTFGDVDGDGPVEFGAELPLE